MRVAVIGAGPAGLFMGHALARRGHQVDIVDRDGGPAPDGSWPRRGVMQFHHAHSFRPQVFHALQAEIPAAIQAWLASGAELLTGPFGDRPDVLFGIRSRRSTFEAVLRAEAIGAQGLSFHRGHVDEVIVEGGRATAIAADGVRIEADLIIDASGRSGRATRSVRPAPAVGGPCGISYVSRQYQLRAGADWGPLTNPIAFQAIYDGYMVLVFPHERGMFSVVFIRSSADRELAELRHNAVFDIAAAQIPGLAAWVDPARARPITSVLPGGALMNLYRGQRAADDGLVASGLIFLGDAVCTTTPNFGRGMATTMMQCVELIRLLDHDASDLVGVGTGFDTWCERELRPWVEDHVTMDDAQRRRWEGGDVDLSLPLPSDLIMEAAQVDPSIGPAIGPYMAMLAGPASLRAMEPAARAVYETGWRPPAPPGPTRDELSDIIGAARAAA
jgi:2-polyprenyl-6-methoxyphenol hydroxylase-like FAD-dependent oxidoreductase